MQQHCEKLLSVFYLSCDYDCMDKFSVNPAKIYSFKVNSRETRKRCEICSKLTIKTSERRH